MSLFNLLAYLYIYISQCKIIRGYEVLDVCVVNYLQYCNVYVVVVFSFTENGVSIG